MNASRKENESFDQFIRRLQEAEKQAGLIGTAPSASAGTVPESETVSDLDPKPEEPAAAAVAAESAATTEAQLPPDPALDSDIGVEALSPDAPAEAVASPQPPSEKARKNRGLRNYDRIAILRRR